MKSSIVLVAAAIIILGAAVGKPLSAQQVKEDPFASAGQPRRQTDERPFGGPPPMARGLTKLGRKCRTPEGACTIEPARPLGSTCSCHHRGKNIKGRVERGGS
jgi:hypothetical protein